MPLPPVVDSRARPLRDLRISVTDRCNFRCDYCMPREVFGPGFRFLPKPRILTFEEIALVAETATELGVRKLRLTGGEPLLRNGLPKLVALLAKLGPELALTTNGVLLAGRAKALRDAGLQRVTVSLDALDNEVFQRMSATTHTPSEVLEGIECAQAQGLGVKVNCVVRRGQNENQVPQIARYFKERGITVRFIEFMDVGLTNGWRLAEVVTAAELLSLVASVGPLAPIDPNYPGEVARRYRYQDGSAEIGLITSVTAPFCGSCTRARLSADGHLFTCLFASRGTDLRPQLRGPDPAEAVRSALSALWQARGDAYSELRTSRTRNLPPRVEMSYIGG